MTLASGDRVLLQNGANARRIAIRTPPVAADARAVSVPAGSGSVPVKVSTLSVSDRVLLENGTNARRIALSLNPGAPSSYTVGELAMAYLGNGIFICSIMGADLAASRILYRSTDWMVHWTELSYDDIGGMPAPFSALISLGSGVVVGATQGHYSAKMTVWKSTDWGLTWTQMWTPPGTTYDAASPLALQKYGSAIYLSCEFYAVIFKTTDEAVSWSVEKDFTKYLYPSTVYLTVSEENNLCAFFDPGLEFNYVEVWVNEGGGGWSQTNTLNNYDPVHPWLSNCFFATAIEALGTGGTNVVGAGNWGDGYPSPTIRAHCDFETNHLYGGYGIWNDIASGSASSQWITRLFHIPGSSTVILAYQSNVGLLLSTDGGDTSDIVQALTIPKLWDTDRSSVCYIPDYPGGAAVVWNIQGQLWVSRSPWTTWTRKTIYHL
jgi:hypothetical protein